MQNKTFPGLSRCATVVAVLAAVAVTMMPGSRRVALGQEVPRAKRPFRVSAAEFGIASEPHELARDLEGWPEYAAIVVDGANTPWIFWDQSDGTDSRVYASRVEASGPTAPEPVSPLGHVAFKPAAAVDSSGHLWVCWASWHKGEWDIEGRIFDGSIWRSTRSLVKDRGSDLSPCLTADTEGRVWLVWQAHRGEDFDILAKYWKHGVESETMIVSQGTACDDYRPSLAVGTDGTVWAAWDGWKDGSYEVFVGRFNGGSWISPQNVSHNPGFDCYRPRCVGDLSGGLWVVWNVVTRGEPQWGTVLARVTEQSVDPVVVPPGLAPRATNFAQVLTDGENRPWVFWQERQPARRWKVYATCLEGGVWTESLLVREQAAKTRQFAPCVARSEGGDIWVAWAWNRSFAARIAGRWVEGLRHDSFTQNSLAWRVQSSPEFGVGTCGQGREVVSGNGQRYQLYWGDLHNHSELSDGRQPLDHCFNLCRDVYDLDFVCMADHDINVTEGEWRFTQAAASATNEPGRFVAFSGYESSYQWAPRGGHRSVCHPGDEGAICRYREGIALAEHLHCVRRNNGIAVPHHIGRSFAPIDWENFDPAVQPIVEICSVHGIFEYFGNPWKMRPAYLPVPLVDRNMEPVEEAYVQDGWARGLRFGVVGSTDSHYNHSYGVRKMGLAAVYAEELTREGLFDAFRARRTYGTTGVRLFLDFRVNGHLMGEEIVLPREKAVYVRVNVEAPLEIGRLDIVRNNEVVFSKTGGGTRLDVDWKDPDPTAQSAYYYARVTLVEDNFAWSSPVWVDRTE